MGKRDINVEEWKALLKDCANRPEGMKFGDWCRKAGVSKSNYYYWKHRLQDDSNDQPVVVRVNTEELDRSTEKGCVEIECNGFVIRVKDDTPMDLLSKSLEVIHNA